MNYELLRFTKYDLFLYLKITLIQNSKFKITTISHQQVYKSQKLPRIRNLTEHPGLSQVNG